MAFPVFPLIGTLLGFGASGVAAPLLTHKGNRGGINLGSPNGAATYKGRNKYTVASKIADNTGRLLTTLSAPGLARGLASQTLGPGASGPAKAALNHDYIMLLRELMTKNAEAVQGSRL